jgi:UDP-N-acetylmuramate dehydrogenase
VAAVVSRADRDALEQAFGARVRFDEPLSRHTSFRIGGPADVWVEVADAEEIRRVQAWAAAADLPLFVLGGGTNVLVSDRGVRGIVVHLGRPLATLDWRPNGDGFHVRAGAALPLKRLVTEAVARDLTGLEFAEGIPGTVGGGLLMNAGAFGGEISEVVEYVDGVDAYGEQRRFPRSALRFGYRRFDLPPGFIVTRLEFLLKPGDRDAIRAKRDDAKRRRDAHQPLGYPNAGSIFKNPPGDYAGRLIEHAGLKGLRHGAAMISTQHANFIVNLGGATAADVRAVMCAAARRVHDATGVRLEPEIKLVGDWSDG